jgi:hypothetical protein
VEGHNGEMVMGRMSGTHGPMQEIGSNYFLSTGLVWQQLRGQQ